MWKGLEKINKGIKIKIVEDKRKEVNFGERKEKFMGKGGIGRLYNIRKMGERGGKEGEGYFRVGRMRS